METGWRFFVYKLPTLDAQGAMRFFRKLSDGVGLEVKTNGISIKFSSVDGGSTGYLAATDQGLINTLVGLMEANSGGITEVSHDEFVSQYLDVKKKGLALPPQKLQREELSSRGVLAAAAQARAASAVPVAESKPTASVVVEQPATAPKPFSPRLGRKGKA